ncbi:hypothetical protein H9X96_02005 [Pedobacter sp. N36a]|uniref:hypothetical protein n=1 Tax=Pedobacter sp. N36a TaxID=2767996 RepID=UPI00165729A3|nr:hypothetical protein [Pedobacter sp. N36a]MBC8984547.1 hypothetical protein [Pedobacter sp. N36a]
MKKLLLSVMACYALSAGAQEVPDNKNYLYLYSDSIIYAKKIQLRPDFSGYWQLRVDSRRVPVDQVKFFNNEDGFFANTKKLTYARISQFSERIIAGKINLYQERPYDPFSYDRAYRNGYSHRPDRYPAVDLSMYYNKGYEDIKKVSYKNLQYDMADNPESMKFLDKYRKSASRSKIMYVTAGASIIAGFVSFLTTSTGHNDRPSGFGFDKRPSLKPSNFTASYVLMGVGLGMAVGGYAVQSAGAGNIENAVDAYNRELR